MKTCKKCGRKSRDDAKFCLNCGEPFTTAMKTCKKCGAESRDDAKFCLNCGEPFPTAMKTCKKCGVESRDDAEFCLNCGEPFTTAETTTQQERQEVIPQHSNSVPVDETTVVVDGENVIKSQDNIASRKVSNKKKPLIIAICIVAIIIIGTVIWLIVQNNIVQQKRKEAASEFISVANEFYKLTDKDFTENMKNMNKCNKSMISAYDSLIYDQTYKGGRWYHQYSDGCKIYAYNWIKMCNHWKSHIYGYDFKRCKENQTEIAGFLDELNTFYEKIEINVNGDLSGTSETIVNIKKAITDLNTNYSAYYNFLLDVDGSTEYKDYKNDATRYTRSINKSLEKLNTYLNNIDTDIKGMEL